jgi:hypothetical protein
MSIPFAPLATCLRVLWLLTTLSLWTTPSTAGLMVLTRKSAAPSYVQVNGTARTLYERSSALLVSVEDYKDWQGMKSDKGLDQLEEILASMGFDVYRMKDPNAAQLRSEVGRWIAEVSKTPNSRAFFYFSGHGLTDSNQVGYIVPADGLSSFSPEFAKSAISASVVHGWTRSLKSKHSLFVFDSCMSGGMFLTRGNPEVARMPENLNATGYERINAPGVMFLTAADETIKVPVESNFLPVLIRGIKGEADIVKDGYVTGSELGEFVFQTLKKVPPYAPRFGIVSTTGVSGDIIFLPSGQPPQDIKMASVRQPNERLKAYTVHYFRKTQDGQRVYNALDEANVRYLARPHAIPDQFETNTLGCHPAQPIEVVRELGRALIKGGVKLRAIDAYDNAVDSKKSRLEVLTNARAVGGPVLTEADLDALDQCRDFWKGPKSGGFLR